MVCVLEAIQIIAPEQSLYKYARKSLNLLQAKKVKDEIMFFKSMMEFNNLIKKH